MRDRVWHHEVGTRMSSFVVDSVIHGHHIYKATWESVNGEELKTERETGNPHDLLAAVTKLLREERRTVGHLPRRVSPLCSAFLRRGRTIKCTVNGHRKYSKDLPQGGVRGALPATIFLLKVSQCVRKQSS